MTFCYVERENIEGLEGTGGGRITHHAIFPESRFSILEKYIKKFNY